MDKGEDWKKYSLFNSTIQDKQVDFDAYVDRLQEEFCDDDVVGERKKMAAEQGAPAASAGGGCFGQDSFNADLGRTAEEALEALNGDGNVFGDQNIDERYPIPAYGESDEEEEEQENVDVVNSPH